MIIALMAQTLLKQSMEKQDVMGKKKKQGMECCGAQNDDWLAGATGLEPATSGVTDQHSNQLSYAPV